ncbi:hypothetical protein HCN44_000755 [Aphidius gifuensis]|uniref:Uncharacterized protein n=1 Tax=Aphidius gifuensis TaxID=684658 RepID=A0A835CS69_APHGI|nr:uncharacterized protein PFB0765w-like [Aphidius gifuensis]KAF7990950.1 hypothetical protein HCN44_000755 [Aphidius gifuensis]
MKEPIFLTLLLVFSLTVFAHESVAKLKVSENSTVQRYGKKTNGLDELTSSNNSHIYNTSLLSDLYTTEGLIVELLTIEDQFYDLHDKVSFKKIYESFLNRLSRYLRKIEKDPEQSKNIKALQYSYAIAATKLYTLNHNFYETDLELNITKYFTIVVERMKEYKNALEEVNMNEYERKYRENIDVTVREANNFVKNDLQSAIDESIEKLDENIVMLINELSTKREVNNKIKSLEKTRFILKDQLILKTLFGTLQFVGASLALLGPVGAAVGFTRAVGSTVDTNLLPKPNGIVRVQLTASDGKNIQKISEHLKNKGKILGQKLYLAEHEIEDYMKEEEDNYFEDIKTSIKEYSLEIMQINSNNKKILDASDLKKLTKFEKNVLNLIKKERNVLINKRLTVEQEYEENIRNHNLYSVESVDNLYNLKNKIGKLENDGKLQKEKETIENYHKSAKLKVSELENAKISFLEEYEKIKRPGEVNNPESSVKLSSLGKSAQEIAVNYTRILRELEEKKQIQYESRMRLLNSVHNTVSMGESAFEVYSKTKNDQSKIKAVLKIDQARVEIEDLREYEQSIYETLIPFIQRLVSISSENNFDDQSHVELDIKKWKIKDAITDVQKQVLDMIKRFDAQNQFEFSIDQVNYGIQTMIKMYDRIQDEMDRMALANYIATISRNNKITNDPKMNEIIDTLELVLKANMVLHEYEQAINAFKQHVFPYAEFYLGEFSVMLKYNNPVYLINRSIVQIESLREKMIRSTTALHSESQAHIRIDLIQLSEQISTIKPYFTWSHKSYKDQISKLLQGQEITLRASTEQFDNRHAVMFNNIGVYFKMENLTMQAEFDEIISNLHINMIHLGDSYYRCGNKTFIMSQCPQTFEHNVMPNRDGEFESGNVVYQVLTKNRAILSPFTMWKLSFFDTDEFNFDQFTKYINESIDLRLVGTGQYVYPEPAECKSNLEEYYKLVSTTN